MEEQTRAIMGKEEQQSVSDGYMASRAAESINPNHFTKLRCLKASDDRVTCGSFRDRYCMLDWTGGTAKASLANRTEHVTALERGKQLTIHQLDHLKEYSRKSKRKDFLWGFVVGQGRPRRHERVCGGDVLRLPRC